MLGDRARASAEFNAFRTGRPISWKNQYPYVRYHTIGIITGSWSIGCIYFGRTQGRPVDTQTVIANSSGLATWTYKASSAGSYSVSAKVTLGSQTVQTNTVTFSVQ